MTTEVTAKFDITAWDDAKYDEPAEGPPLGRAAVRKTYTGHLEGTSVAELLMCAPDNPAAGAGYIAQERVVGTLDGKAGTFVLQHGAIGGPDGEEVFGFVVPNSGTGELSTLRGTCRLRHGEITLRYDLD